MKNILLLVHEDAGQEARLKVALDVVHAVDGHLVCLDLIVPVPASDPFGGIRPIVTEREQLREWGNRREVEETLGLHNVVADWIEAVGDPAECLVRAAALCDLVVISSIGAHGLLSDGTALAADVIVRAKRPVLAVPEATMAINLTGHALIAWDGSPDAIAAMRAAIPLLKLAEVTTLLEIDDGSVETPAEEAAAYLGRHGVLADVRPKHLLIRTTGTMILEESRRKAVDYVIMGGFGHSHIREALFGGVSRTMLSHSRVPMFLVHS